MFYWYFFVGFLVLVLILIRSYAVDKRPCLRVLMYHKISNDGSYDGLTVTLAHLEKQFEILLKEEYNPILLSDLVDFIQLGKPLPRKPVLITFDDGYRDNYTIMYPLLKKYGMKANIFLVPSFIGNTTEYLHVNDIRNMNARLVEFGLHSYDHKNYRELSPEQIDEDIAKSKQLLHTLGINFQPCFAFPYGAFPKKNPAKLQQLNQTLTEHNIVLAFRIGNRLNSLPLKNPLLIQRLDIRGEHSIEKFNKLLQRGKEQFKLRVA